MKKLIAAAVVLAVVIYFGYPYLEALGHPEEAVPGLSEMLEAANEKINITVDGAKNLYVQGQKIKELIDIASWKEIDPPEEAGEPIIRFGLGDKEISVFNGYAGIQSGDGETAYYSMDPDAFEKIKDFITENAGDGE